MKIAHTVRARASCPDRGLTHGQWYVVVSRGTGYVTVVNNVGVLVTVLDEASTFGVAR